MEEYLKTSVSEGSDQWRSEPDYKVLAAMLIYNDIHISIIL